MDITQITEKLLKLLESPNASVPGVEYLSFLRKNPMDYSHIPCEDYAVCLNSLKKFAETLDLNHLLLRKLKSKNVLTYVSEIDNIMYFNIFLSSELKKDIEETLTQCFGDDRLIPMYIKVK